MLIKYNNYLLCALKINPTRWFIEKNVTLTFLANGTYSPLSLYFTSNDIDYELSFSNRNVILYKYKTKYINGVKTYSKQCCIGISRLNYLQFYYKYKRIYKSIKHYYVSDQTPT